MKNKFLKLITSSWFALQALFMLYWPIYLYNQEGVKFYEMLPLGCIILPASGFIMVKNKIIRKTSLIILLIYSIFVSIIGTLAIAVASPTIEALWITIFIIITNLALTLHHYFSIQMTALLILSMIILAISLMV